MYKNNLHIHPHLDFWNVIRAPSFYSYSCTNLLIHYYWHFIATVAIHAHYYCVSNRIFREETHWNVISNYHQIYIPLFKH